MSLFISVVMPVLNNRDGFIFAINSIRFDPAVMEIIVIDGGSTDGTVDEIIRREKDIAYWETGKDKSIADAFNRGIAKAQGEFIAILNSDDYWEGDVLKRLIEANKENPTVDVFFGGIRYIDKERNYSYVRSPSLAAMKYRMSLFHPAMFIRKSCYQDVGGYDLGYTHAMDSEWCHRAIVKGKKFCEIPVVLANMSLGGVSDREYKLSLQQYRHSLMKSNLCSKPAAFVYYFFFIAFKYLVRQRWMYPLKRLRDRLIR